MLLRIVNLLVLNEAVERIPAWLRTDGYALLDYAVPTAHMLPDYELNLTETPSPLNPLGAKGVGETGCVGAPPAIVNAVLDALAPLGITHLDMPLTSDRIWRAIDTP